MDLAVKNNNESHIMLALKSEVVSEHHSGEIVDIISQTFFTAGQKIDLNDTTALAVALYAEVRQYFPFLKIGELRIAMQAGVRNSYGEYFGLNIKTFHGWIRAFQISDVRKSKLNELKAENKPVKIDKERIRYEYWCKVFEQVKIFKETGKIEILNPLLMFREFWNCKLLLPTKDEAEEYKHRAVYELDKRREMVKKALTKKEYQEYQELSAIVEGFSQDCLTKEQDGIVKSKAAELCLLDYFRNVSIEEFETKVNQILTTPF